MNEASGMDRRRFARIERSLVTYYCRLEDTGGEAASAEPEWAALTRNVSEGGILVELDDNLAMGDRIALELMVPDDTTPIEATGEVVRLDGREVGIAFHKIRPEDVDRLRAFVAARQIAKKN
jgi:c-di-GMP-binding flagellar brake protein YcgR